MMNGNEKRFEFGKNWLCYIKKNFNQEKLAISKQHMLKFLGLENLNGFSFLDIGCGSGIHSLAAYKAGAIKIHSFDYDPNSVKAACFVRDEASNPHNWIIEQGSVLDNYYMQSLSQFDIVYSWGVLHHTGNVWDAIRHAAGCVQAKGLFYIALYSADVQINPPPQFWLDVKQKYISSTWLIRRYLELWYIWRFMMQGKWRNFITCFYHILKDKRRNGMRGMSIFTDIRDWLGGWPMEFVFDKDVIQFCENLGFRLKNIATGEANTEFLFVKESTN